jgi:proline utilization trans-activator
MAMALGMHRSAGNRSNLTKLEHESRKRIWWALYFYERMSASKLGQPITVRDEDIDVEMPSNDGLSPEEACNFADPAHICANVGLARILGDICKLT